MDPRHIYGNKVFPSDSVSPARKQHGKHETCMYHYCGSRIIRYRLMKSQQLRDTHFKKSAWLPFLTSNFSAAVHLTLNPTRSTIEHPPSLLSIHDRDFSHVGLCLSMEAYWQILRDHAGTLILCETLRLVFPVWTFCDRMEIWGLHNSCSATQGSILDSLESAVSRQLIAHLPWTTFVFCISTSSITQIEPIKKGYFPRR